MTGDAAATHRATVLFGNGFVVTSLLWGGAFASLLDHRMTRSALFLLACGAATMCGIIHSPLEGGALFSPLAPPDAVVFHIAAAYAAMAVTFLFLGRRNPTVSGGPELPEPSGEDRLEKQAS